MTLSKVDSYHTQGLHTRASKQAWGDVCRKVLETPSRLAENFLPLWLPCLITIVPGLTVATFLIATRVKETKGIDYAAIDEEN